MGSRMDKYHSSSDGMPTRSQKNSHLYEELNNNKIYKELTDVENNSFRLDEIVSNEAVNTREDYKKIRLLNSEESITKKSYLEEKNKEEFFLEDKNYNINDVLEKARKNRVDLDPEEKKKHQKTVEYSILEDLNQEKEKNKKLSKKEEENLEELIHTITSNSLRQSIDDELLSDLMPTQELETCISKDLLEEIKEKDEEEYSSEENKELEDTMDKSFYTKSMDLSEEDFEFDDEDEEDDSFLEESDLSVGKRILIILFILLVVAIMGYIAYHVILK